ncbi:MobF family relaxase [Pengzhenrongella sicca]|uniref:Relaxase domain-containing protein n=1 Tax=Pengzhenrongella sicca TaxID=2819238 RepID=A0A8A4ZGI7_9MICO|nr:MobF family relaxase [Pengzhenrongella sicca]QTE30063.1 relaxase domain-containing protein [Pengzhenrongella sicca]
MRRLTAGAGYKYLLRHTASGDCDRPAARTLTAYYMEDGYPPGRWLGTGLVGVNAGAGLAAGTEVLEEAMANLYGQGRDPISAVALGRAYPTYPSATERIKTATAGLPSSMGIIERAAAIETLTKVELAKPTRTAVAGFDVTFTAPKSASTIWALADAKTQAAVVAAHRSAVDDALAHLEATALFTRTGTHSCAQVPTRGMLAAAFDHWDTRTGDPNLHTHVVIANKVQGGDGVWRSIDSRALHQVVVEISELYDNLFADHLAARLPVSWGWRHRGPARTPAFEVNGVDDDLLKTFSTRSTDIDAAMTVTMAKFMADHGRTPNRVEVTRLRQQVTRSTRPAKHVHSLREYLTTWRRRATNATGKTPEQLIEAAMRTSSSRPLSDGQVSDDVVGVLAGEAIEQVITRRSTWTRSNMAAEAARVTRGLRIATTTDRLALHARVVEAALGRCVSLAAPEVFTPPAAYRRANGSSMFSRPGEVKYTDLRILDAETRLLAATETTDAPAARRTDARDVTTAPLAVAHSDRPAALAADQADAVTTIATSGRRLDVLVGPAGTGKTTTLLALRRTWEATHGSGSVVGLAPSATAAAELADALQIGCENTAKWLYESTGAGRTRRTDLRAELTRLAEQVHPRRDAARLAYLANAIRNLDTQAQAWQLQPGQLLIVDEASLAGTFTLDTLLRQAVTADAKLLLVGDHAQLSAVDAGGAFNLLAERGHATTLTSLWRFTSRWEAHTTRLLRAGKTTAIDDYAEHDRLTAGPAEAMLEAAYAAWQTSEQSGVSTILLAADSRTVTALNARAHADRVADQAVAPTGITTTDGVTIAVGDRVVTRCNNRRLRVSGGGHVRNGDLWDIAVTHDDGSLTLVKTTRNAVRNAESAPRVVRVDAGYVAAHVDLGYACTTHRAQGITVDHAHVLAAPGMTRENLYVAMTRGRVSNHIYTATDAVDPMCDHLPDPHGAPAGRDVLERILATTGAELSATQTLAANLNNATSLERLEPIRDTLVADAATRYWMRILTTRPLTPEQIARVDNSPARGALIAALRQGERAGYSMEAVLARLIATRLVDDQDNAAHDIAAVLHDSVTRWLDAQDEGRSHELVHAPRPERVDVTDPAAATIAEIDDLIAGRISNLTAAAISTRPDWMRPLGDQPDPGQDRNARERTLDALVSFREVNHITDEPTSRLGDRPPAVHSAGAGPERGPQR